MRDAGHYGRRAPAVIPAERGAEWCPALFWNAAAPYDAAAKVAGAELEAFINEARLIVSCPDCGGAQLAALEDPRFMCVDCGNVDNGGAWRPVVFPVELPDIIAVLEARVDVVEQSWVPGVALVDLAIENVELGVEVPIDIDIPIEVPPVEVPVDLPTDDPGPVLEPPPLTDKEI